MKSPTSSVGRMDDDGILKGSATNERSRKTTRSTGKKLAAYSTQAGSGASAARLRRKWKRSTDHRMPVTRVSRKRISAKFIRYRSSVAADCATRGRPGDR